LPKPLTIGIAACSAEGAALCYRTLCSTAPHRLGAHAHPPILLHGPALADFVPHLDRNDMPALADIMLDSARRLQAAGADFVICPDNTVHCAMPWVRPQSPLPWLHIAEVVAAEARRRGVTRAAVLGTHWLTGSRVYPDALAAVGIAHDLPTDAERAELGRIIMDELVPDIHKPASLTWMRDLIARMADRGSEAVILGCTELPIVLNDGNSALPTLDSTRLLAKAALDYALSPLHQADLLPV